MSCFFCFFLFVFYSFFFFQAEDGIRDFCLSRGLGDVYKRQEEGDAGNEYASGDKLGLMLPGLQEELLEAVAAVGKPVILVLSAGSAIDLSWAEEHVDAIIDSWYPGARGGKAVAEAIFGEYSPSGKLPVTFYQGTENLPEFTDYSMAHRTYRYTNENVLYPFCLLYTSDAADE